MLYVLIWSYNDSDKRFVLRSDRYFLGRPDHRDAEELGGEITGFDVLIFNPDDYSEWVFTGFRSLAVSRRHALIYRRVSGDREELVVRDHGSDGSGSRNGTLVNNKLLVRGGEAVLHEGDTIRLSRLGPLFIVGVQRDEKTILPISAGAPMEIPTYIARRLIAKGVVAEHASAGNRSFIVVSDEGPVELGGDLVVDIRRITWHRVVLSTISSLKGELYRVKDSIRNGREDDVRISLKALEKMMEMETYKSVFEHLKAQKLIDTLRSEVIMPVELGVSPKEIIENIDVCIQMLDKLEKYILGIGYLI